MSIPIATLISNLWPFLHATSESDAVFVTAAELEQKIADRLSDLAMEYGLFVERDVVFVTLATGQQTYTLPPRHLSTLHVALSNKPLVASSTKELQARDRSYQTTPATTAKPIRRFSEEKQGFNVIGFHPVPAAADAGAHPEIIFHRYPCEVTDGVETPKVIGDLLEFITVGESYRKESDFCCPEIAQACEALAGLYTGQMANLWGNAQ